MTPLYDVNNNLFFFFNADSKNSGNFTYSSISKMILPRKMDEKIIFAFNFAFYPTVPWFLFPPVSFGRGFTVIGFWHFMITSEYSFDRTKPIG